MSGAGSHRHPIRNRFATLIMVRNAEFQDGRHPGAGTVGRRLEKAHCCIEGERMRYRVHQFNIRMTRDEGRLEQFLNSLDGEVVAIIPNITPFPLSFVHVDFLLIVEKVDGRDRPSREAGDPSQPA
jgi:hypothetical protein